MSVLVDVLGLKKYYPIRGGILRRSIGQVKAVDGVSLSIRKGEIFGVVGESGCGKTTLAKTIIRLLDPTAGSILFDVPEDIRNIMKRLISEGQTETSEFKKLRRRWDIATFGGRRLRELRRKMGIVYQDPTTSLNPRMLVKDIVAEPLIVQGIASGRAALDMVVEMLNKVGLSERHLFRYPHEFSGGQRQRIAVARALITRPQFVVLDEPTSSVDVSVRAQLLNLFLELRKDFDLTYMFISHDLSVVECIADRVAVMYLGKIVEFAPTGELYKKPMHPYSIALFSAIPVPDPTIKRKRVVLSGDVPSPVNPPAGCRFHPRCEHAMAICKSVEPDFINVGPEHFVACHLYR